LGTRSAKSFHYNISGVVVFSKYEIVNPQYVNHPVQSGTDILFRKGTIFCEICGFDIANTHVTVGGGIPSASFVTESIRTIQIESIIQNMLTRGCDDQIICGDFNMGPEYSSSNYNHLARWGCDMGAGTSRCTWDHENPLIETSLISKILFSECPSQRCDFIVHRGSGSPSTGSGSPSTDSSPQSSNYQVIFDSLTDPMSDHYGVVATVRR
jgi:endonuclease/exonuclease/phosphatase family metal-dependent hydrolase